MLVDAQTNYLSNCLSNTCRSRNAVRLREQLGGGNFLDRHNWGSELGRSDDRFKSAKLAKRGGVLGRQGENLVRSEAIRLTKKELRS